MVITGTIFTSWLSNIQLNSPQSPNGTATPTPAQGSAKVTIEHLDGNKVYWFDPTKVVTLRDDLFNPGHFSMLDVLVHLSDQNQIDLKYHFDTSMNTFVIETINGESGYWFHAFYSGGWNERNVFRMDHYPWKEKTTLTFFREDSSRLEQIYEEFKKEVRKFKENSNKLIIPEVIIRGQSYTTVWEFKDVEVTPHNLRDDVFKEGVLTAIDVIMSLGDQDKITYQLQWYDEIGTANPVKSFWVESINENTAYELCGFVYEAGSFLFRGFTGNHIHLPSDVRILNSPDYVEFFWICLGPSAG